MIGLLAFSPFVSDPRYFTSSEDSLKILEASVEDALARAQRTINVGNSAGAREVMDQNIEIIFAVDLSRDVDLEELRNSLKYAEEYLKKVMCLMILKYMKPM